MNAYTNWQTIKERYEDLAAKATASYQRVESRILNLELETLRVPTNHLSRNPNQRHCITADYQKLQDIVIEFAGFMVNAQKIKDQGLIDLLAEANRQFNRFESVL